MQFSILTVLEILHLKFNLFINVLFLWQMPLTSLSWNRLSLSQNIYHLCTIQIHCVFVCSMCYYINVYLFTSTQFTFIIIIMLVHCQPTNMSLNIYISTLSVQCRPIAQITSALFALMFNWLEEDEWVWQESAVQRFPCESDSEIITWPAFPALKPARWTCHI